ncbi:MAG: DNA-processing protein DprA, partial [Actinomycetota bacterium]
MSDKKFWLGLKLIPELDRRLNKAIECFGSPQHIWEATSKDLIEKLGTSPDVAQKIAAARDGINLDTELQRLESEGIELLTPSDSRYPMLLREIHSPPILFTKGDLIKRYTYAIAIVGARRASIYGKTVAEGLAEELSKFGITIVSGMARGIDSHAHLGALKGQGGTIGVLGCGLDEVYPPENRRLYRKIGNEGSLISEQPLGTPPFAQNFPARNRIISGLSLGVVIVEAGEKSGALITADLVLEQGREVM